MYKMESTAPASDDQHLDPPDGILERLRKINDYTWDESLAPFHSTYDNWHFFGSRWVSPFSSAGQPATSLSPFANIASSSSLARLAPSIRMSPAPTDRHPLSMVSAPHSEAASSEPSAAPTPSPPVAAVAAATATTTTTAAAISPRPAPADSPVIEQQIVARVSYHVFREERSFHIARSLIAAADPNVQHILQPIELHRLQPLAGELPIVVAIYTAPGENEMMRLLNLGPAFYRAEKHGDRWQACRNEHPSLDPPVSLECWLQFAVAASHVLELTHSLNVVHGEIRGDAFHYNKGANLLKLTSFGFGVRSFADGLTSTGWSALSRELGAKNKLLYISPEQTGRTPDEPDTRTDIYSLGVLFWSLLTQRPPFEGDTPLDIVQGVLSRKIPNVSAFRIDVPDVVGRIIQKCTSKTVSDRYHSASGLRHDLAQVQQLLSDGDTEALKDFQIASRDVSSLFVLPSIIIGRERERADILRIIERVAKTHSMSQKGTASRYSDGANLSNELMEWGGEASSEGTGSVDGGNRRSGSFTTQTANGDQKPRTTLYSPLSVAEATTVSGDNISSADSVSTPSAGTSRPPRLWERHQSVSFETRSLAESVSTDAQRHSIAIDSSSSLSRQLGSAKFRRRGHCEVVTIEGADGLGKSCLVQSVMADARRRGYCATAKFDQARKTAFGPLLKILSSLFRQVWGDRNTETPFHQMLKQYVRPVWPNLHKILELPEFLLGPPNGGDSSAPPSSSRCSTISTSTIIRNGLSRRGSSPDLSLGGLSSSGAAIRTPPKMAAQSSQEFLRAGASTRTIRLMNTFLDVLRMFAQHKFICFCLEDLHFADQESLELVTQIVAARLKMVVIITYRPKEMSAEIVQKILAPPESEEILRSGGPSVTRITLAPLQESDIIQYVSATLCRPRAEIHPLAIVIQSKTAGNPYYMREMLNACHRKKCVWYDYQDGHWKYNLEKLYEQFQGEENYDVLNTAFITRRLGELPPASRSILAWAALLGQTFSFELISKLMGSEFQYRDEGVADSAVPEPCSARYSVSETLAGLEAAISTYIIVPADRDDDRFRFAHDRYIQAASALKECNERKMHFIIARTLMRHHSSDPEWWDNTASHICESIDIIRRRIPQRADYRKLLFERAKEATASGAKPTAAKYYSNAVALLQPNPWDADAEDVSYDETVQLYLRAAECYLFMGHSSAANVLLQTILDHAGSALDKAPAWVLQSRIFVQSGDSRQALDCLRQCLDALGIEVGATATWEMCDAHFERVAARIRSLSKAELINPPAQGDDTLASLGAVLAETVTAAWWSDCLYFYHLALLTMETHLNKGSFPQSGMAFLFFAMIALSRFNDVPFAVELANVCLELLDKHRDPYTVSRGYAVYSNFLVHVHSPIAEAVRGLEGVAEDAAIVGDRSSTILNFGLIAQLKFFASEPFPDLESYCQYGCEEIPNWHLDTRGGSLLVAVRQVSRSMQGKTRVSCPTDVMSDDQHNAITYKNWLASKTNNGGRSLLFYESLEMVPLFLYGHFQRTVDIGKACYEKLSLIWSARNTRLVMLFYGLAMAAVVLREQHDPRPHTENLQEKIEETLRVLRELRDKINDWEVVNNVNYLSWSRLLDAQVFELQGNHGSAVRYYEEALDHASSHGFVFEEALGNYLMADIFIRCSARRSARSALQDAISLYRQQGASGVANHIEAEHTLLLHGSLRNRRCMDASVQTDFAGDAPSVSYRPLDMDPSDEAQEAAAQATAVAALKGERLSEWQGSMQPEIGTGLTALDMIDLTAILKSSQTISSILRVQDLLPKMCNIILNTCGSSATLAAIVVRDESRDAWCVASSGSPDRDAEFHMPGIPVGGTHLVTENVVLYSLRFREVVFVRDLLSDERFGNVSESWLQKNPHSKSVIAIPICHAQKTVLGVLYLEGHPGSFTDRSFSVLQTLVGQIAISYSNAMAMKAVEKVSAENVSMVSIQKQALAKARDAELQAKEALEKAKVAEKKARENVKLAEDAAKAKSIFLANVSHELRTPLNGVIGNSELLRDGNLSKDQLEMADSIRVSADLLLTVINDILDFSRMEADKMNLHIVAFNPAEMVREVVRAASYATNNEKTLKKKIRIIQDINLPSMLIFGDPIRLHQVLGNLISNSLKFTEEGTITIGARVESEDEDQIELSCWVQDTGIGISDQQQAKLFQPFSQADASTARKYGGSGLGLSICKSLIENQMKGKIQLDSQASQGTKAWFTVKFDKARPEVVAGDVQGPLSSLMESGAHTGAASLLSVPDPGRPMGGPANGLYTDLSVIPKEQVRVCIAEDNVINARIAVQHMERLGFHNIDAYGNGLKAVEGLREKAKASVPYHIILMDVQMPVLDGYEATKLLRTDPIEAVRSVLIIAMTASAVQGDREKCLAAGMNDYLAKPVRSDVLRRKLDAYVGGRVQVPSENSSPEVVSPQSVGNVPAPTTATPSQLSPMPSQEASTPRPRPAESGDASAGDKKASTAELSHSNGTGNNDTQPQSNNSPAAAAAAAAAATVVSSSSSSTAAVASSSSTPSTSPLSSATGTSAVPATKRQPRKLIKIRANSSSEGTLHTIATERPAAVLQKKMPSRQNTAISHQGSSSNNSPYKLDEPSGETLPLLGAAAAAPTSDSDTTATTPSSSSTGLGPADSSPTGPGIKGNEDL